MQANLRLKDEELRKANILIDELEVFRFNHHVLARFCPKNNRGGALCLCQRRTTTHTITHLLTE